MRWCGTDVVVTVTSTHSKLILRNNQCLSVSHVVCWLAHGRSVIATLVWPFSVTQHIVQSRLWTRRLRRIFLILLVRWYDSAQEICHCWHTASFSGYESVQLPTRVSRKQPLTEDHTPPRLSYRPAAPRIENTRVLIWNITDGGITSWTTTIKNNDMTEVDESIRSLCNNRRQFFS